MSVDRIRDIQRMTAEAEERARIKQIEAAAETQRQMLRVANERQQREAREAEEHRKLVKRVFEKSGVLAELRDVETQLLGRVAKHRLIVDFDQGNARLVWGSRFDISQDGKIGRRRFLGLIEDAVLDYSYIDVQVGRYGTEDVQIKYTTIKADEWKKDKTKISEAIADAYLNPQRVFDERAKSSSGGDYGSDSGPHYECCCS
jgi:hypothetical protein